MEKTVMETIREILGEKLYPYEIKSDELMCPDEIWMSRIKDKSEELYLKLKQIRENYEKRFVEIVKIFWKETDEQTSIEEKTIIYDTCNEEE